MSRIEFRLPDVGEGLSEAEIVRWLVGAGDTVTRDQAVVEVETDKSLVELPAPDDGTIVELGCAEGDVVPVGDLLLVMETAGDGRSAPQQEQERAQAAAPGEDDQPAASPPAAPTPQTSTEGSPRRVKAAPAVRRLAVEHGIDLEQVAGTGPAGRVTKQDLLTVIDDDTMPQVPPSSGDSVSSPTATPTTPPAPTDGGAPAELTGDREPVVEPLRGLRRQIARNMTVAWQQVPHITDFREIDATALTHARQRLADDLRDEVERFTYLPLLIRAVTVALAAVPRFNASVDMEAETITYHRRVNLGLAAATDDGLLVPVLHDADRLGLAEIARRVDALATGARARSLTPDQMRGGTCTLTNFGSFGGWIATPIIRHPEAAIVGFGRIRDRVVPVDGVPQVRPILPLSVSADHRLIDGDAMGAFLNRLTALLEDPILLLAGGR